MLVLNLAVYRHEKTPQVAQLDILERKCGKGQKRASTECSYMKCQIEMLSFPENKPTRMNREMLSLEIIRYGNRDKAAP